MYIPSSTVYSHKGTVETNHAVHTWPTHAHAMNSSLHTFLIHSYVHASKHLVVTHMPWKSIACAHAYTILCQATLQCTDDLSDQLLYILTAYSLTWLCA